MSCKSNEIKCNGAQWVCYMPEMLEHLAHRGYNALTLIDYVADILKFFMNVEGLTKISFETWPAFVEFVERAVTRFDAEDMPDLAFARWTANCGLSISTELACVQCQMNMGGVRLDMSYRPNDKIPDPMFEDAMMDNPDATPVKVNK